VVVYDVDDEVSLYEELVVTAELHEVVELEIG